MPDDEPRTAELIWKRHDGDIIDRIEVALLEDIDPPEWASINAAAALWFVMGLGSAVAYPEWAAGVVHLLNAEGRGVATDFRDKAATLVAALPIEIISDLDEDDDAR